MSKYVGVKLIEAVPMMKDGKEGYEVIYKDGYKSWSPKEIFEDAHIMVGDNNTVVERNINEFIVSYDVSKWGDKTTIVNATLANGFIMTEASSCVDPANFNIDIGASICKDKIQSRLWGMLGFMLQSAVSGVKRK